MREKRVEKVEEVEQEGLRRRGAGRRLGTGSDDGGAGPSRRKPGEPKDKDSKDDPFRRLRERNPLGADSSRGTSPRRQQGNEHGRVRQVSVSRHRGALSFSRRNVHRFLDDATPETSVPGGRGATHHAVTPRPGMPTQTAGVCAMTQRRDPTHERTRARCIYCTTDVPKVYIVSKTHRLLTLPSAPIPIPRLPFTSTTVTPSPMPSRELIPKAILRPPRRQRRCSASARSPRPASCRPPSGVPVTPTHVEPGVQTPRQRVDVQVMRCRPEL